MQELTRALGLELPNINAALARYVEELPPNARPVASHVLTAGGKRLRPFLTLLTGRALGAPDETLYALGAAIEMLHAATLLHDDILDNATLRRGKPAAHTHYGAPQAILAGDAMLAKALLLVSQMGNTRLTSCISEAVMRTAEGELLEFAQLRNPAIRHADYLAMITGKTAWMLRASCELGALAANASPVLVEAAANFGLELGIAFQMVDDALDFSPPSLTGKPMGGDVKEGKITPPLSLYMASLPAAEQELLHKRLVEKNLGDAEMEELCAQVYEKGYADKTRAEAYAHLESAARFLSLFPDSPSQAILARVIGYIQTRER